MLFSCAVAERRTVQFFFFFLIIISYHYNLILTTTKLYKPIDKIYSCKINFQEKNA